MAPQVKVLANKSGIYHWIPHHGKRELLSTSCSLLTFTQALWHIQYITFIYLKVSSQEEMWLSSECFFSMHKALRLEKTSSHHMNAGNWNWVLCKSSRAPHPGLVPLAPTSCSGQWGPGSPCDGFSVLLPHPGVILSGNLFPLLTLQVSCSFSGGTVVSCWWGFCKEQFIFVL